MAYREDKDLEFLGQLSDEELSPLVDILIKDEKGAYRTTEELTNSSSYKKYAPQHHKYWKEIAAEIQLFGGNTLASLFRGGKGVLYREVLIDVANKLDVNFSKNASTERIEQNLLLKLFEDLTEKISQEQLKELSKEFNLDLTTVTPAIFSSSLMGVFAQTGMRTYQLSTYMSDILLKFMFGRAMMVSAGSATARILSIFTGPIGWSIMGGWTLFDIASPAFRVTVPAVVCVASLRTQRRLKEQEEKQIEKENQIEKDESIVKLNM